MQIFLTRVRVVGNVLPIFELGLYLETFDRVPLVCFGAEGGQSSTQFAVLRNFSTMNAKAGLRNALGEKCA